MLQIARESEIELSIKIILALVIGMFLSDAIGWTGSFTITYAMILMTYLNRGISGMRQYYRTRMQCQLLMCILLFIMVVPLQTFTQLEPWIIFMITSVPVAVLLLYLYYKYSYTPIILTGVISPMIILSSAMKDSRYYSWRMVLTFLGLVIGWGISLVYPFRNKVGRTEKSLRKISVHTLRRLNGILESVQDGNVQDGKSAGNAGDRKTEQNIAYEMEQISAYMAVLRRDIDTFKYRPLKEEIRDLTLLQRAAEELLDITGYCERNADVIHRKDSTFYELFLEETGKTADLHMNFLKGGEAGSGEKESPAEEAQGGIERLYVHANTEREIGALAALVRYRRALLPVFSMRNTGVQGAGDGQ